MKLFLIALALPLVGAFSIFLFSSVSHRFRGLLSSGIALGSFLSVLLGAVPVFRGGTIDPYRIQWLPEYGITLGFYVDGLSILFGLLISGIGCLVCVYATGYLHEERIDVYFWFSLLLFMGAMLGVVFSEDFISLLVFWELTSVSSFLLIGIEFWNDEARRGALNALFVTAGGGLCLLTGFLLLAVEANTFSIVHLLEHGLVSSPVTQAAMVLILLGAFTKSAHFPFHFWLPQAMAAPTPISAYLHSATMVKAGLYLIARLNPVFVGHAFWSPIIMVMGLTTFLVGGILAIGQEDAKALLAYSTISQLGMISFMLGIGTEAALLGAIFHILAHATFKGALFMGAGAIDHTLGTRNLAEIGPLRKSMPMIGWTMALCGWSMAGMIPFSGFISKEAMFEGVHHYGGAYSTSILVGAVIASVFTFVYSFRFVLELPFGSARVDVTRGPEHSPSGFDKWCLTLPPMVLCGGTIFLGVGLWNGLAWTQPLIDKMIHGTYGSLIHHGHAKYHFALWHGVKFPLKMTGVVVASGLALYALLPFMRKLWKEIAKIPGPEDLNRLFQDNVVSIADRLLSVFIRGPLPKYLRIIITFITGVAFLAWFQSTGELMSLQYLPGIIISYEWIPFLLAILVTVGILFLDRPVPAVIAVGILGFIVSMVYLVYRAPDLIMTQIAVETVSIVIFLWVLKDIDFDSEAQLQVRVYDLLLALTAAVGVVYFLLRNLQFKHDLSAPARYYITHSLPEAWGKNMVNVILVDFRALDTLGEISVLGIATVGILALLRITFNEDNPEPEDVI
ncbi:MAG: hydrogen gas-evolving membrane-bound hydrogenase subunit E [bacterium]